MDNRGTNYFMTARQYKEFMWWAELVSTQLHYKITSGYKDFLPLFSNKT